MRDQSSDAGGEQTSIENASFSTRFGARCLKVRHFASSEWFFYIFSYSWLWAGWALSKFADNGELWVPLAGSILLGLPFYLTRLYLCTVKKTFLIHQFRDDSFLRRIKSSRVLPVLLWIPFSLLSGLCLLYLLHSLTVVEWMFVIAGVPTLRILAILATALSRSQYQEYLAFSKGLFLAQIMCAILLVGLLGFVQPYLFPVADTPLLSEVMREQGKIPFSDERSVIAQGLYRFSLYFDTASTLALKFLSGDVPTSYQSILAILMLLAPLSVPFAVSAFLIPGRELQRILLPLKKTVVTTEVTFKQTAIVTTWAVIVLLFIYPAAGIGVDQYFKDRLRSTASEHFELILQPHVESIEGRIFKAGTGRALEQLKAELIKRQAVDKQELERQLDDAYQKMEQNVDIFLDQYYSLPAEYFRMAKGLTSALDGHIRRQLSNALQSGEPFSQFEQTTQELVSRNELALKEFDDKKKQLLRENEMRPPAGDFWEIREISQKQLTPLTPEIEYLDGTMRATGSAGAGAVSAVVAGKVTSKIAAKGTLKIAATAVTKAATSKAGAAGAGAAAGAALGSVVPGAGTIVGAITGLGVGLIVGISVDAAMLKIEEYLSRDRFKREILSFISETKAEHKQSLGL